MADRSELVAAVRASAARLGINPSDLVTAISFETEGTLSPSIWGGKNDPVAGRPTMLGLIQFDPENQCLPWPISHRSDGAVEAYLRDRGVKPGMGMLDVYSTINAGCPGLYNRSDTTGRHRLALGHACQTLWQSADASSRSSQRMLRATAASWALTRLARLKA
jgi:hypothetical protein